MGARNEKTADGPGPLMKVTAGVLLRPEGGERGAGEGEREKMQKSEHCE